MSTTLSSADGRQAGRAPAALAAAVVCVLATATIASAGQPRTLPEGGDQEVLSLASNPQVLVVFSDDSSQSWIRQITDGFYRAAAEGGASAPAWYFEYLDAVRFQDERHVGHFRTALREKYRDRPLDLIVPVSSSAIEFVMESRDELWPDVPVMGVVYASGARRPATSGPGVSTLSFESGLPESLAALKTVFPGTTAVFVVSGISAAERRGERALRADVERAGLVFHDVPGPSMADVVAEVAHLPEHAILFVAGGQVADQGNVIPTWRLCEMMAAAASRPTFMLGSQFLGCGIVGGLMRDYVKVGAIVGEHAIAAVSGRPTTNQTVPFAAIATMQFDARQLERWGIPESRLPAGSVVAFREPNVWRDHRRELLIVAAGLILQTALIAALLYERRGRQRAEIDSRRSLALAAHVDRRGAMATLTGSMAHELNQPLTAILYNADAAERLVASNRATPDDLREILRDIRSEDTRASRIIQRHRAMLKPHELERRPIDIHAVVRESLELVAHDAMARRVQIDAPLPSPPCIVLGDQILLQQVVVNLVINAMDAMAGMPPSRRRVTVRSALSGDSVEISVADCGPGLTPEISSTLFQPFMTTKADGIGIGLAIARGTLDAHGGSIDARNNVDGGATFRFTLPCVVTA